MKKFIFLALAVIFKPLRVFGQRIDSSVFNDEIAYASLFAGSFSLLLSIVIGAIATYLVLRAAKRLGGGLFGLVLNYVGVGMLLIVIGTILTFSNPWIDAFWSSVMSTVSFATGYIFMVIGANRLFKGIMST